MPKLSFTKNPRPGQQAVIDTAVEPDRTQMCVQLPTGYGKTFTATAVYSKLQHAGRVDRLLYLVPTVSQLDQFAQDGKDDLQDAGVEGGLYVCDVRFSGAALALKQHRQGTHQVFACTIQGLSAEGTGATIKRLMENGRWMIVVDEYHHYGFEKTWGRSVLDLQRLPSCKYLLAMSATPHRKEDDSAFGEPEVIVTYEQAVKEGCVKPMTCHTYTYRVDALEGPEGDIHQYTMGQLYDRAGGHSPEKVQKVFNSIRFLPKYISPLVDAPLARLTAKRFEIGLPLQALIGASCCSHAQLVCDQVRVMYPELRVDWVGTGPSGRNEGENRRVLKEFCPPKKDGKRDPADIKLDVLVHVGMAGEGLDTVYVSEVIHLNPANKNNSNDQENGRGARFLEGVRCCVNVEKNSDYARKFPGRSIEKSFDAPNRIEELPDAIDEGDPPDHDVFLEPRLPLDPHVYIKDVECIEVNTHEVKRMKEAVVRAGANLSGKALDDKALELYRTMRRQEGEQFNARAQVEGWDQNVKRATSFVTSLTVKVLCPPPMRPSKDLFGDIKKRINTQKKIEIGPVVKDVEVLRAHWRWLRELEISLIEKGVPTWLA